MTTKNDETGWAIVDSMEMEIPQGYFAKEAIIIFMQDTDSSDWAATITVGTNQPHTITADDITTKVAQKHKATYNVKLTYTSNAELELNGENTGKLPITVVGSTKFYAINAEVICEPTEAAIEEWQLRLYKKIMDNYALKMQNYEQALKQADSGFGFVRGSNPATVLQTEQQELKRGCLNWLFQTNQLEASPVYSNWSVWFWGQNDCDSGNTFTPEMNLEEAKRGGLVAGFAENSFEWELMTYTYFPYFYGAQSRWHKLTQLTDSDLQFQNFYLMAFL